MLFIIITVLAVLGLAFRLTFFRFLSGTPSADKRDLPALAGAYGEWLGDGMRTFFKPGFLIKVQTFYRTWVGQNYPGWRQWVFAALVLSFGYCAASGFFFAIFVPRGMFGVPLLCHVMAGGLFAISLAAALILRAGAFRPDAGDPGSEKCGFCPALKNLPKKGILTTLFWMSAAAGLCLIVSALASMLPYFHYRAQMPLFEFHRYGALADLLLVMAYFDFGVLPRRG
jgi:hypothetical protein